MKDSITIQRTGFYTTIQDKGRFGYAALGIPESGAMDRKAMLLANALVNNDEYEAVLEYTLVGPTIEFHCDRHFVITGGITEARLQNNPIENYTIYLACKGDILELKKITKGCRGYLAITGGLQTSDVLGSKSMYAPITSSRHIHKVTEILVGATTYGTAKGARIKVPKSIEDASYLFQSVLKVYKGPEYDFLSSHLRKYIEETSFSISKLWNRMAIQLEETVPHDTPSIRTGPVIPGTIQLTPSGRLMVLMKDCQVTGGYPRILQLSESAMDIVAQKKQGDVISFLLAD
ncbi:biotin-dependent carboxyltransferase family protein [uncultured Dokdonia sp.]|uniref:5-oxoprolinase subunit C family protein n=1 Tax=uncultured Dokdonia sp. TaxID=575653 RepID=UPI0026222715|nr:biotin-dependent carboxyltransferase family protein [uncultured Dokdonia sp.]